MPIYEFMCRKCRKKFEEVFQTYPKKSEDKAADCPHCGTHNSVEQSLMGNPVRKKARQMLTGAFTQKKTFRTYKI